MTTMTHDEWGRIEKIDALAARWLLRGDTRPATEVWDAAARVVDDLAARAWGSDIRDEDSFAR